MNHMEKVDLKKMMDRISENEIVLPDFQRGFAWKDKNKQIALIASVLTKLPIGTVLFLEAGAEDYGYKKIGRDERNIISLEGNQNVKALLDGQQRITTLMAFFSTRLQAEEDLISPTLYRRYFLNLPSFQSVMEGESEDIFGGSILRFPSSLQNSDYPEISSEDIRSRISFVTVRKDFLYENALSRDSGEICSYCREIKNSEKENSYLVPLYYVLGACDKGSKEYEILKDVVRSIADEYKTSLINWMQSEKHSIEQKKQILYQTALKEDRRCAILNYLEKNEISEVKKILEEDLSENKGDWVTEFINYLISCIRDIGLYEIKIEAKDKDRAVDIYENLNLGGKALSVFDLILAKSSKNMDENKKGNLMTQIVEYIQGDHRKDYEGFWLNCEQKQSNSYKNNIVDKGIPYSASERIGCWNQDKQELSAGYIKALMNLLGIISYFSDGQTLNLEDEKLIQNISSRIVKKKYLLEVDPSYINFYIRDACKGLDRASVFLQGCCGIRKESEIHYNLMWSILGTVFLKDEWFKDKDVLSYMEAWYWSVILSGGFRIEQNRAFIYNLQNVLLEVNTLRDEVPKKEFVINLCRNVLKDKKFADREILLMENPSIYPEKVIGNTICQYYLSNTYRDILQDVFEDNQYTVQRIETLNPDLKLEKHHIMPIGSLGAKYKSMDKTQDKRKDGNSPYNSPLNYLLISEQANRLIANSSLKEYIGYCHKGALREVGIEYWDNYENQKVDYYIEDEALKGFLNRRYNHFEDSLHEKLTTLLNCGELYEEEDSNGKNERQHSAYSDF